MTGATVPKKLLKHQLILKSFADVKRVDVISGVADHIYNRSVKICKESGSPTQSGHGNLSKRKWIMNFNILHKWENGLMGWTSSADPLQALQMKFDTKEAAVIFASKHGFAFTIKEEPQIGQVQKSYAENFTYSPNKLKQIRTK